MSKALPPRPRTLSQKRSRVIIVASQYNDEFTDALVENTEKELGELNANISFETIRVPGAFEIPVVVESVIQNQKPACVIALGLIIRGQTAHGDMVAESVTQSLQQIAVYHVTPVIHEVILCDDKKQAYARCVGSKLNRGKEAARAASAIVDTMSHLNRGITRVLPDRK